MRYGEQPEQFGELSTPDDSAIKGVAVVIHGGFWRPQYDLSLGRPLAADLVQRGWAVWNVEYRRTGSGGGWPETFNDIGDAIDRLAGVDGLPLDNVVAIGHSAGGLLAVWAAMRNDPVVPVTAAISQAGVLDLGAAIRGGYDEGAVTDFLGDNASQALDPTHTPPDTPVWCLHASDDDRVPIIQSRSYVTSAARHGMPAELVEVTGGHFGLIDARHPAWVRTREILELASA